MRPTEGTVIANRFQLIRELGHGSMGSVWLAHHLTLEVRCAVKFIAGDLVSDPRYKGQFNLEARTMAKVQSPHVVRVLDHDICGDVPYIALEYLEGEDLRTRLLREKRLSPLATHKVVSQIARGLSKAHAAGIVHRDLKPENIYFAREGDEEVVKLVDFGTAKWAPLALQASSPDTVEGLIGTPEYMSPEQACGRTVDPRSDYWSLAVVAYECLTGRFAFEGASICELLARITKGALPVPSHVAPELPPAVDGWWARAASRSVDGRFQSAGDLADALGRALGIVEASALASEPPRALLAGQLRTDWSLSGPSPSERPTVRVDGSSPRWRRLGLSIATAGLTAALVLAFAQRKHGAGADPCAVPAPHAVEVFGRAPRPALVRVEVQAPMPVRAPVSSRAPKRAPRMAPRAPDLMLPGPVARPFAASPDKEADVDFGI